MLRLTCLASLAISLLAFSSAMATEKLENTVSISKPEILRPLENQGLA